LNPNAKLKPSGIEWLGDIPKHWETPPLYVRFKIELGKMLDESRITGKHLVSYLRNVDVQWDSINTDDLPEMDIRTDEYSRYTLTAGDLLVCEGGEVGRAAVFRSSGEVLGFQKALHRLRPARTNENSRFMFYTLYWASHSGVFLSEGNPNTIPHLTGENLRRYRFPTPPLPEQIAIAEFLDRETAKIDRMVEKVELAIARLQEYRTALITAAVTGKIDVRPLKR
jgi:type I restriction enzyme S subunit